MSSHKLILDSETTWTALSRVPDVRILSLNVALNSFTPRATFNGALASTCHFLLPLASGPRNRKKKEVTGPCPEPIKIPIL